MGEARPTIGLMLGDRNGIGPEVACKLLADASWRAEANVMVVADPAVLAFGCEMAGFEPAADVEIVERIRCPNAEP